MDMNKKDKHNINTIEDMRFRMHGKDERNGCILQVDGKYIELKLETEKSGFEEFRARMIEITYFQSTQKAEIDYFNCCYGVSCYLTSGEIYAVIKEAVKSYIKRGF